MEQQTTNPTVCLKSPDELERLKAEPQAVGLIPITEPSNQRRSQYFQMDHLPEDN